MARQSVAGNGRSVDAKSDPAASAASSPAADVRHVDLDRGLLAVPLPRQRHLLSDPDALELLGEVGEPAYRLAVHADDYVARPAGVGVHAAQAGALGRRAR